MSTKMLHLFLFDDIAKAAGFRESILPGSMLFTCGQTTVVRTNQRPGENFLIERRAKNSIWGFSQRKGCFCSSPDCRRQSWWMVIDRWLIQSPAKRLPLFQTFSIKAVPDGSVEHTIWFARLPFWVTFDLKKKNFPKLLSLYSRLNYVLRRNGFRTLGFWTFWSHKVQGFHSSVRKWMASLMCFSHWSWPFVLHPDSLIFIGYKVYFATFPKMTYLSVLIPFEHLSIINVHQKDQIGIQEKTFEILSLIPKL